MVKKLLGVEVDGMVIVKVGVLSGRTSWESWDTELLALTALLLLPVACLAEFLLLPSLDPRQWPCNSFSFLFNFCKGWRTPVFKNFDNEVFFLAPSLNSKSFDPTLDWELEDWASVFLESSLQSSSTRSEKNSFNVVPLSRRGYFSTRSQLSWD